MKIMKWLDKNLEEAVMICLLMIMTIVMGAQILSRYVFNYSISWSEELTRYLFVWSGFLSISFATEKGIAIRIDLFTSKFSQQAKRVLTCAVYVVELLFFAGLTPTACAALAKVYASGRTSTAMGMPMWILQTAPAVGFILADLRILERLWRVIRGKEDEECRQ